MHTESYLVLLEHVSTNIQGESNKNIKWRGGKSILNCLCIFSTKLSWQPASWPSAWLFQPQVQNNNHVTALQKVHQALRDENMKGFKWNTGTAEVQRGKTSHHPLNSLRPQISNSPRLNLQILSLIINISKTFPHYFDRFVGCLFRLPVCEKPSPALYKAKTSSIVGSRNLLSIWLFWRLWQHY